MSRYIQSNIFPFQCLYAQSFGYLKWDKTRNAWKITIALKNYSPLNISQKKTHLYQNIILEWWKECTGKWHHLFWWRIPTTYVHKIMSFYRYQRFWSVNNHTLMDVPSSHYKRHCITICTCWNVSTISHLNRPSELNIIFNPILGFVFALKAIEYAQFH